MKFPSSKISKTLVVLAIAAMAAPVAFVKADHGGDNGNRGRGHGNSNQVQLTNSNASVQGQAENEDNDNNDDRGRGHRQGQVFKISGSMTAQVVSVNGTSLVVKNTNGLNVTVNAANAKLRSKTNRTIALSDVMVNDVLQITGSAATDGNSFNATTIKDNSLKQGANNNASLSGTVVSLGANSFVLNTGTAQDTINFSSVTTFTKTGATSASSADLAANESVSVTGTFTDAAHTIVSASTVNITVLNNAASLTGTVSSVGTNSFVLASNIGSVTVNTAGATITGGTILATESVSVTGTFTDNSHTVVNASAVNITTPIVSFSFTGPITAVPTSGSTFTITETVNNIATAISVDASAATLTKTGVTSPTLANFHLGDSVQVTGTGLQGGTNVKASALNDTSATN